MAKANQKPEAAKPIAAPAGDTAAAAPAAAGDEAAVTSANPLPPDEGEQIIPAAPRTVRARVLAYCALGAPNDVIDIEADQVELVGDVIDTSPAAVAYAESLKA